MTAKKTNEAMPCPRCGAMHQRGEYGPRPELATRPLGKEIRPGVRSGTPYAPPDMQCPCGAVLRHTAPIFAVDPYGWHWRIL
jgi:hypothetical protein